MHSKEVIIISTREKVNEKYNNYLKKLKSYIDRKEITISYLAKYLGVSRQMVYNYLDDTVYAYLDGTHIIPYDKVLLLNELMSQESPQK